MGHPGQPRNGSSHLVEGAESRAGGRVQLATTLLKGLDLMGCIAHHSEGLTMKQLQELSDTPRTTILRLLRTLECYGFVSRRHGFYLPAEKFFAWTRHDSYNALRATYRPLLESISKEVQELVVLGIVEGQKLRHLDFVEWEHQVVVRPGLRERYVLEQTAMGKLVMSVRPDLARKVRSPRLRGEIAEARSTGIAWNCGESFRGVIAVATWAGTPAPNSPMISVSWPEFRFNRRGALLAIKRVKKKCESWHQGVPGYTLRKAF
jgi:DNA-binding IclR family transcriptional regulator